MLKELKYKMLSFLGDNDEDSLKNCMEEKSYFDNYKNSTDFNITAIVSGKLANLTCNEAVFQVFGDEFLDESLEKVTMNLRKIVERCFGTGGVILKPFIQDGKIYTDIVSQSNFLPIKKRGENIEKAAFLADLVKIKNMEIMRIEIHSLDNGLYKIENKAFNGVKELPLNVCSKWEKIPKEIILSGVDRMLFSFLKCPAQNRENPASPYGAPITYGHSKLIKMICNLLDEIPGEYFNKRAFVGADETMFENDKLPKSGLYKMFRTGISIDTKPFWEIFSPEIRHTAYFQGLDYLFGLLEKSMSVNKGVLTDLDATGATATAIRRSTMDTFALVDAMRKNVEITFDELLKIYSIFSQLLRKEQKDFRLKCDWSFGLIEDSAESWKQMVEAYNAGVVGKEELRSHLFNISNKQAIEELENLQTAQEIDEKEGQSA